MVGRRTALESTGRSSEKTRKRLLSLYCRTTIFRLERQACAAGCVTASIFAHAVFHNRTWRDRDENAAYAMLQVMLPSNQQNSRFCLHGGANSLPNFRQTHLLRPPFQTHLLRRPPQTHLLRLVPLTHTLRFMVSHRQYRGHHWRAWCPVVESSKIIVMMS